MAERNHIHTRHPLLWGIIVIAVAALVLSFLALQKSEYPSPGYGGSDQTALQSPNAPLVTAQTETSSVLTIAESLPDATHFAALLSQTGMGGIVTGKGPYTIFVPTDRAFALLPSGTVSNLSAAQLKRLVEYHIVSGRAIDVNAIVSGTIAALSKDMLNFSADSTGASARVNSSIVLEAYKGTNGVVYLVNQVLLPPTPNQ